MYHAQNMVMMAVGCYNVQMLKKKKKEKKKAVFNWAVRQLKGYKSRRAFFEGRRKMLCALLWLCPIPCFAFFLLAIIFKFKFVPIILADRNF